MYDGLIWYKKMVWSFLGDGLERYSFFVMCWGDFLDCFRRGDGYVLGVFVIVGLVV